MSGCEVLRGDPNFFSYFPLILPGGWSAGGGGGRFCPCCSETLRTTLQPRFANSKPKPMRPSSSSLQEGSRGYEMAPELQENADLPSRHQEPSCGHVSLLRSVTLREQQGPKGRELRKGRVKQRLDPQLREVLAFLRSRSQDGPLHDKSCLWGGCTKRGAQQLRDTTLSW